MPDIAVPQGNIRYRETGSGPPIVLLHGYLMDSRLWDGVMQRLSGQFRCIALDLPLGAHRLPMAYDADLGLRGLAALVDAAMAALDLRDVTLVGNDSGGAIAQVVAAEHPQRVGRLVLTPCDCFGNCPPALLKPLVPAARVPGLLTLLFRPLRHIKTARRLPFTYGWLTKTALPHELIDDWVDAFFADKAVRRDLVKVTRGLDSAVTRDAARKLARFTKPALLGWAVEDRLFPLAHAEQLAAILPDVRIEHIHDSRTWVMLDQPARTAELISQFVQSTTGTPRVPA
jgi:pimeloyl-ACP methyl ester carboxylesterase